MNKLKYKFDASSQKEIYRYRRWCNNTTQD